MDDVERVFRQAHGQAVATLTRLFGDITLAEDAVQDAYLTALSHWPRDGVPDNPAGWIITTARNRATRGAAESLDLLDELADELNGYCPLHAARGALLDRLGRPKDAATAYARAAELAPTETARLFLRGRATPLA